MWQTIVDENYHFRTVYNSHTKTHPGTNHRRTSLERQRCPAMMCLKNSATTSGNSAGTNLATAMTAILQVDCAIGHLVALAASPPLLHGVFLPCFSQDRS